MSKVAFILLWVFNVNFKIKCINKSVVTYTQSIQFNPGRGLVCVHTQNLIPMGESYTSSLELTSQLLVV